MQLLNIPAELRDRTQWVSAGADKVPINPRTKSFADPTDPTTWGTFEEAITAGYKYIGYVLHHSDPYTIIDLDNKPENPAPPEELERQAAMIEHFASYTERSASGRGAHIIIRGTIPKGARRGHTEVYSDARYMICTGDVIRALPIVDRQDMLTNMYSQLAPTSYVDLGADGPEEYTDREIHERALNAENGEKYNMLTLNEVDWQAHYPSQSEADLALLSMYAYYSKNNAQCERLFLSSPLGRRDKASRPDYINRMLRIARTKQHENEVPAVDFKLSLETMTTIAARADPDVPACDAYDPYSFPPGLIGQIAEYTMRTSIRPVKEIALATAISMMAGIAARTYNTTTRSGLNLYTIMLAKTGCGKEAAQGAIERLVSALRNTVPAVNEFLGPAHFASGQAIVKTLNERPCFLSVLGEIGITLKTWCDPRANASEQLIRRVLLDCYGKSGAQNAIRPHAYSDKEKNTSLIQAPNLSILGESVPDTFYGEMDINQISSGLIPRFLVIEYEGERPDMNEGTDIEPDPVMLQTLADLATTVIMAKHNNAHHVVPMTPGAMRALRAFNARCDDAMREHPDDVHQQLWNRAHLNAMRLATLCAVGENHRNPMVNEDAAHWAIGIVQHSVSRVLYRFQTDDVGRASPDGPIANAITAYARMTDKQRMSNGASKAAAAAGVIPFKYFKTRLRQVRVFRDDRRGVRAALEDALRGQVDCGVLAPLSRAQLMELGAQPNSKYYAVVGE